MLFNEDDLPQNATGNSNAYLPLARKYRPQNLDALVGQEVMVTILRNAFAKKRIAQAYILTGVRGIGKTTTARILAKCLNCQESDDATPDPCGTCDACVSITNDRNMDVLERDAASHTGVDAMRELIEGIKYLPAQSRYKVYIIDEAHMLSTSSWNALLKTLEEPPEFSRFIFATTEIHKIPVTILSRCQRFDLRRLDSDEMRNHLHNIAGKENIEIDDGALNLIAKAAQGSVRDGLSLLDQAISSNDDDTIKEKDIIDMLSIADYGKICDLMQYIAQGKAEEVFALTTQLYQSGSDPILLLQEMMAMAHLMTRYKITPNMTNNHAMPSEQITMIKNMSTTLTMGYIGRLWQIMLKGISEINHATMPQQAFEMIIARLLYVHDLPPPGDIKRWFGATAEQQPIIPATPDDQQADAQTQKPLTQEEKIKLAENDPLIKDLKQHIPESEIIKVED